MSTDQNRTNDFLSVFPARLAAAREKFGISQRELARRCGLNQLQIYRYEHGLSDPSATIVLTIARILGVSADYLLGLTDEARGIVEPGELNKHEKELLETFRT